jgi:hypothetical protein
LTSTKEKTMRNIMGLFLFISIFTSGCTKHRFEESTKSCNCDNPTKQLDIANSMIPGEWTWISTGFLSRGSESYYETPQNTNSQITYKFTADSLTIIKNGINIYKERYSVGHFGDLSNTPTDSSLIVKFIHSDSSIGVSMLLIDNNCMLLVNSYNDAGDDVLLTRK